MCKLLELHFEKACFPLTLNYLFLHVLQITLAYQLVMFHFIFLPIEILALLSLRTGIGFTLFYGTFQFFIFLSEKIIFTTMFLEIIPFT